MTAAELSSLYRDYLATLNTQDWPALGCFVDEAVIHNGHPLGLLGYRALLEQDFASIPDLRFEAEILVSEPPFIASRLNFDCMPRASFMGLPVDGRKVRFSENVIYRFRAGRIAEVWSVIDKAAIERQLAEAGTLSAR